MGEHRAVERVLGEGGGVGPVYRAFLWVALLHVALISAGFLILAASFQFPEILRESAQTRLALFTQSQGTIVPAYYMMGMTGLTQIALAVLLHRAFAAPQSALLLLALVAGVLGGAFQAMGFLRWPIAIPYLAQAMAHATTPEAQATVALLEGTLNRYAGMVVGEHLGFLGQAFWTILVGRAALASRLFSPIYGGVAIVLGILLLVSALEQLGGPFEAIGMVSAPVSAAWLGWLIAVGVSLARTDATGKGPRFGILSAAILLGAMGGLTATALM